ncbi:hypothetical protein Ocin01_01351 [Orchesella cincta]|uniref:Uncharacterized protein n=1 Tax=Orchesella cincta TaxID=48709 RepID=A0A1D2NJ60_ORCCI|nr:hypothetical protein Ocin01_01351 [Orchesella cincta]
MKISACCLCGVPIDQGMAVFAIIEMFFVTMHIKHLVEVGSEFDFIMANEMRHLVNPEVYKKMCLHGLLLVIDILKGVFCLCLFPQIICAFILYFVGYRKKNVSICIIWVVISAFTFVVSLALVISTLCEIPRKGTPNEPDFWLMQQKICGRHTTYGFSVAMYELYLIFGIWVVVEYTKSLKSGTQAPPLLTSTVAPVPPPQEIVAPPPPDPTENPEETV